MYLGCNFFLRGQKEIQKIFLFFLEKSDVTSPDNDTRRVAYTAYVARHFIMNSIWRQIIFIVTSFIMAHAYGNFEYKYQEIKILACQYGGQ